MAHWAFRENLIFVFTFSVNENNGRCRRQAATKSI